MSVIGVVAAAVVLGMAGSATANRGNDAETIRMRDDCDPATFNAALMDPTACVGNGDTTFEEFLEELEDGGDRHWQNNPENTDIKAGEGIHLVNRGGEFHTFTMVDAFLGGCVPELNMGLAPRDDAFCFAAFTDPATALPAGAESDVDLSGLAAGHDYHFQCMIHPWMQTTIEVRHHH